MKIQQNILQNLTDSQIHSEWIVLKNYLKKEKEIYNTQIILKVIIAMEIM